MVNSSLFEHTKLAEGEVVVSQAKHSFKALNYTLKAAAASNSKKCLHFNSND